MKLVGKDQLYLTYGMTYEVIAMRLVESIKPYIEYRIIDDVGSECWHKGSSFFTLEEWRDIKLVSLGI